MFSELALRAGAKIVTDEIIKDRPDSLREFLSNALKNSDAVVTSGGVSMGKHDHVRNIFMELGVKEHFWKVAQKPGKPIFFVSKGGSGRPSFVKKLMFGSKQFSKDVLKHLSD